MRTRSRGDGEKQELIRARYREKERRKYGGDEVGKSSEDVWKSRVRKVAWGEAFNVPFPEPKASDEDGNRREREKKARLESNANS